MSKLRVVLTGPESTGKTTLTRQLAAHYQVPWVQEYARTYLNQIYRAYQQDDLYTIAIGQVQSEREKQAISNLIICDTDLLTIKIWSEFKYKNCDTKIMELLLADKTPTLYILCGVDIPWEYDPQRENPEDREELYAVYQENLLQLNFSFIEVKGTPEDRLLQTLTSIDHWQSQFDI